MILTISDEVSKAKRRRRVHPHALIDYEPSPLRSVTWLCCYKVSRIGRRMASFKVKTVVTVWGQNRSDNDQMEFTVIVKFTPQYRNHVFLWTNYSTEQRQYTFRIWGTHYQSFELLYYSSTSPTLQNISSQKQGEKSNKMGEILLKKAKLSPNRTRNFYLQDFSSSCSGTSTFILF